LQRANRYKRVEICAADALRGFAPLPLGKPRSVFHSGVCKTEESPLHLKEKSFEKVVVSEWYVIFVKEKMNQITTTKTTTRCKEKKFLSMDNQFI
jgi:hypothetical protein